MTSWCPRSSRSTERMQPSWNLELRPSSPKGISSTMKLTLLPLDANRSPHTNENHGTAVPHQGITTIAKWIASCFGWCFISKPPTSLRMRRVPRSQDTGRGLNPNVRAKMRFKGCIDLASSDVRRVDRSKGRRLRSVGQYFHFLSGSLAVNAYAAFGAGWVSQPSGVLSLSNGYGLNLRVLSNT